MTDLTLLLLPGLDGSGVLLKPFVDILPQELHPKIVCYPSQQVLGYDELLSLVIDAVPTSEPYVILGESFSGPLALRIAATAPSGLRAVILCASFVRSPVPSVLRMFRPFVRGSLFRIVPEFVRNWAMLGRYSTPELRRLSTEAIDRVATQVLAHRVREVLDVDVRQELLRCRVPLLYLQGSHDRVVRNRNLRDVLAVCPKAQAAVLSAPHFVLQTQPAAAVSAVSRFLTATVQLLPSDL